MVSANPEQATSRGELAECLRHLHITADRPSYRMLEQETAHAGGKFPGTRLERVRLGRSTIADVLAGRKFPGKAFLLTFVEACGIDIENDRRWDQAWDRLALSDPRTAPLGGEIAQPRQKNVELVTQAEIRAADRGAERDQRDSQNSVGHATSGESSEPLRSWICDTCGEPITDPTRALVVWRSDGDSYTYSDFMIVHKTFRREANPRHCDPGAKSGYIMNLDLDHFFGVNGLTMLLSWLSIGPLKDGGGSRIASSDLDAFVDLVRRVQVPNYEQARPRFREEDTRYWLDDANEYYPYLPEVLDRVAKGTLGR